MGQGKEHLTGVVGLKLAVVDRELLLEILQLVKSLTRGEVSLHRAILLEVFAEDLHIDNE